MNSIRQVPSRMKTKMSETSLGDERDRFDKQQTLQDCMRHYSDIAETGTLWHPEIRANLEATDEVLERTAGTDINNVFQLTVEVFDYMDTELRLAESVLRHLNMSTAITLTAGQCKLAPLIQVIQDSSHLYHYTVKLLFKLHACLPADTLQGHRERFHDQFHRQSPPNFLRASALAEHVKPMVIIPDEEEPEEDDEPEPLIDVSEASVNMASQQQVDIFDQTFGPPNNGFDDRDLQINSLKHEIDLLRDEIEKIKAEAQRYVTQLKSQINCLEAELEEQRVQKQHALVENEQLRMELETKKQCNTEHEAMQSTFLEAEKRAQATELRYNKLKEKHAELVANHAELLRKSADTVKMLSVTQQNQEEVARTKQQLFFEVEKIKQESEMKLDEQKFEMNKLRRELEEKIGEIQLVKGILQTSEKSSKKLSNSITTMQALMHCLSEKEAELSSLKQSAQLKETSLQQERERSRKDLCQLQGQLKEKLGHEEKLKQKLLDEQFILLQGMVTEAEIIIQEALAKVDDPLHICCTSSPDYLVSLAKAALGSVTKIQAGHLHYLNNMEDAGPLLRALTQFSHLTADTIVNGSASVHTAPVDLADRLLENCRACAAQSLNFLKDLRSKVSIKGADPASVRVVIQKVLQIAQDLKPKGVDVGREELGNMVDKEMAATSAAIEEAVRRIDEMMNQARRDTEGVKLEVNERILNSCTDLMKAIRLLVLASTDLQNEIVESGRGAATVKEFYARNSRWTEGLISAAKAVGWGATENGVKADRSSRKLLSLQKASRHVNEMAANVVASTKTGQDQIEEKDTMDFTGMSLIKLRKEEMESQVKVLELESMLENERLRLGELRKKHYEIAGVSLEQLGQDDTALTCPSSSNPFKPTLMKKPALAQKPKIATKNMIGGEGGIRLDDESSEKNNGDGLGEVVEVSPNEPV
ncbi:Huntingtin-interacting protein 1-related protein [Bagarius yarrelli]|uniref:Huntingtin-interacting protein 1-related protein n=1 Tax=Bagarius yarrelli TaxID=175774 RepID=A0A556V5Y4_BAGYA|nr:Huntingtin-interacting protein 1-related protein [Bagarius yarrelli]